jgi:hypothetical protein
VSLGDAVDVLVFVGVAVSLGVLVGVSRACSSGCGWALPSADSTPTRNP